MGAGNREQEDLRSFGRCSRGEAVGLAEIHSARKAGQNIQSQIPFAKAVNHPKFFLNKLLRRHLQPSPKSPSQRARLRLLLSCEILFLVMVEA